MNKILANENIPFESVLFLRKQGVDVKSIGTDNPSIEDTEVLEIAQKEKRIIFTFDKDYGELIFKYNLKPREGVIMFRLVKYETEEPGKILMQILKSTDFDTQNKITVFDGIFMRQRSY